MTTKAKKKIGDNNFFEFFQTEKSWDFSAK